MRDVALVVGIGIAAGIGGAALVARFLESVLFGMTKWDSVVFAGAIAAMSAVAILAAYIPARRATRVDPMVALRYE